MDKMLYDDERIAELLRSQREHNWDLEKSINWQQGIDFNKYLVPLNDEALLFPGASEEQRKAISQMMGLMIATSIFEMEETLIRLKQESLTTLLEKYPVGPEFAELGEQFFDEEVKHSQAFKRYVEMFATKANIDLNTLREVLPLIENTATEAFFAHHLKFGGMLYRRIVSFRCQRV